VVGIKNDRKQLIENRVRRDSIQREAKGKIEGDSYILHISGHLNINNMIAAVIIHLII